MGRALSRPLRVYGRPISKSSAIFFKVHWRHIVFPVHGSAEWPRQGPPPHLTRETISGRRPADGADTPGGVFRPGENLPGEGDTADIFRRRRREWYPAPPCENKTTVSPSPSSDAKPPGRKTHIHTPPPRPLNVIKIRKYHYIRTDMSIKHICFFMQKTLDKPAPKCGEAPWMYYILGGYRLCDFRKK